MQVYPFIGLHPHPGTLTAADFFRMVGMHPEVARVASVDEIVGVKAVKAKYVCPLCGRCLCNCSVSCQHFPSHYIISKRLL